MRKTGTNVKETTTLIERHRENLMGLPVVLLNAAFEATHGDENGISVPDTVALEAAMAVARITVPIKLSGSEIRFLRKAMAMKAVELAKFLDIKAETLSRWENESGSYQISTNAERILRLRVAHALREKAPTVVAKDDDILDMEFVVPRNFVDPVTLVFERPNALIGGKLSPIWHFVGTEEPRRRLKVVA